MPHRVNSLRSCANLPLAEAAGTQRTFRTAAELSWFAGLLEGEGCFYSGARSGQKVRRPMFILAMADQDVVERAARLVGGPRICAKIPKNRRYKTMWILRVGDRRAVQWMMTLYPLLGTRRQQQIRRVLHAWRRPRGRSSAMRKQTSDASQSCLSGEWLNAAFYP